ncbi:phosphoribosylformylglycinamidine synthase [Tribolium castaneum]|uniref:Phosphoribosylformylglycinamidine synthase n=1 Tax=Tribolium castaneum TaxID=7070 RepID=D2A2F6_TRICA|nr:PREDICTED: phosphoribosylformylglycinamidine synthase [Tribolium castaneum]EFA02192.2 Phosphoribosylformylglycinamidine synthase-like Protein [Tribolium castaneum]|eukprot:XP_015834572.1 PREDICTED: phosphoribosylformylglycinamidine synthase [Tribolium castaneum]
MVVEASISRFYQKPGCTTAKKAELLLKLQQKNEKLADLETELCYHVETTAPLSPNDKTLIKWLLRDPFQPGNLSETTHLSEGGSSVIVEVGPRFNFSTSNSTNAVSISRNLGLSHVVRMEVSRRYKLVFHGAVSKVDEIASALYDRMTECRYTPENIPKKSFNEKLVKKEDIREIDVMKKGEVAVKEINDELGLAFDDADFKYYTNLFKNVLKRNPTNVELFDLAQSNSEHSRHWFFKGKMVIDGVEHKESLIDMIVDTQNHTNPNNVIKFSDNSSAMKGYVHRSLRPVTSGTTSELRETNAESHLIFTAETHNFPTGVAPFSGATTGTGGRIRDVQSVGRGGYCIAGTAGYSVGNLNIPGYNLPWEDSKFEYPNNFAPPLEILVEASNGASDYGNKFGEPLICGFVRSFGMVDAAGERKEWIKPIMFSGGIGTMEANMTEKFPPKKGHQIIKIGGPVYRIGVGGGSASSVEVQGDNKAELDFNAVQRGDAEMEQKLNRVVRACLELGKDNPIVSIHDQGAGGNGNVLKELVEPVGGIIYANKFELGDPTINVLELWGAEYQENNALLCEKENLELLKNICKRERCPINIVGEVTGTGRVVLAMDESQKVVPFNLELTHVLGKMPQKVFKLERKTPLLKELTLPDALSIYSTLERVLRLPSVSSKRYLTNKVDRCVTGLIAQQQCVGPLHTPLADVAVTAISHFGYEGIASSIGEQPIKGLVNTAAGARMTVAEALSNLVFALISDIRDVKCSGNWMWAAKLPGEGAALYDACKAMCDIMSGLGIAIDGGKDSLSMAARVGRDTVKAPGTLVVSTYAPCPDVRKVVTPDLKAPATGKVGHLLFVDLSHGYNRLGGTAVAQVFGQLGKESPDVHNVEELKNAFIATQKLIRDGAIQAGHDVSDGGLIVCLLEMCFAGICGMEVQIGHKQGKTIPILFNEEVGWVLEVLEADLNHCMDVFQKHKVPVYKIGKSIGCGVDSKITISVNNACIESTVLPLMRMWEETSYRLELQQTIKSCADSEYNSLTSRKHPEYRLTFDPDAKSEIKKPAVVKVAVLREEGTNGDREMAAALVRAGFKVWDVTMQDLLSGKVNLGEFRGIIFPGGFSYADVLGSAKGWAGSILFNKTVKEQFDKFYARPDTFSLGVCNGCQLMAMIGWVGELSADNSPNIVLEHNISERFECRWNTIRIEKSPAIMLKDMHDSVFGVWSAHGEGRFTFKNSSIYDDLVKNNCVGLRFTDDEGNPTETYPMNPNGSIAGTAGICSKDGRHLAMMPHPERCDQPYLWPYMPPSWQHFQKSPWEKMFRNAYEWCCS